MSKLFMNFEEYLGFLVLVSGSAFVWTIADILS